MAKDTIYLKQRATMTLNIKEVKYKIAWWLKIILLLTFPLWLIPFLFTNAIFGKIMRNTMQKFQRTGRIENPNFEKIDLNSLNFYNRDMELQQAPQLTIDEASWTMMEPQDVTITTFDNIQLSAFVIANQRSNNNHKWIIAVHGWQQNRYSILYLVKHFYEQGYNILTYDARGHGSNNIKDSVTFGAKEADDLYAVIRYLNGFIENQDFNQPISISLIGNSMGATTILETMCRFEIVTLGVKCGIFDCGYDSFAHILKILAQKYFKTTWFWVYFGLQFYFKHQDKFKIKSINTINKLKYCANIPVLFIHGNDDETVPVTMTEHLFTKKISYEQTPEISELLIIPKAKHVRAITTDYNIYCNSTLKFVHKWTTTDQGETK
ncbi:alpha/beta hydrolase [Spiroplasma endosymbiont of Nebria brevicollis]|uniref:alpha/beta hydrolase n=1 Tax=Spiroplasma endosymbiont of Nebria brevicollis TaxID=3066284 RepID=UPI00313EC91E